MKSLYKAFIIILIVFFVFSIVYFYPKTTTAKPLKMAIISAGEGFAEKERYENISKYIAGQIGKDIEVVMCTDYSTVITSLKIGDADIARMGAFSYLLAVQEAKAEVIARGINKDNGKGSYDAVIITRSDSGIKTLEDIRGKTFAFSDVASTSGYLIPQALFKDAGIDPEKDITASFAGSNTAVIEIVKSGKVAAGATNNMRLDDALKNGAIKEGEFFIVAKAEVPSPPIVVKGGMDPELKKKIQDAYLNMPKEIALMDVGKFTGFTEATDSDYDYLREIAKVLNLNLTKMD